MIYNHHQWVNLFCIIMVCKMAIVTHNRRKKSMRCYRCREVFLFWCHRLLWSPYWSVDRHSSRFHQLSSVAMSGAWRLTTLHRKLGNKEDWNGHTISVPIRRQEVFPLIASLLQLNHNCQRKCHHLSKNSGMLSRIAYNQKMCLTLRMFRYNLFKDDFQYFLWLINVTVPTSF